MTTIIGWDIGGAHLKAALWRDGRIEAVRQIPCTLWLGIDHLSDAWRSITALFGEADSHAVTMTGELAEIFPGRQEGVTTICRAVVGLAEGTDVRFYAGRRGFLREPDAVQAWQHVASANWHASATWIGRHWRDALLIDIGSTTTDIIPIADGVPVPRGFTDAERLETGELVYTGVTRTSLMALAGEVPFAGKWQRVMAENFATTADLYRLTGELETGDDSYPASDGRSKSAGDCRARIARMLGRDASDADEAAWLAVAQFFRQRQLQLIDRAVAQMLSVGGGPMPTFLAAGAGDFLVMELARRWGCPSKYCTEYIPMSDGGLQRRAGVCAPAIAVALLAAGG